MSEAAQVAIPGEDDQAETDGKNTTRTLIGTRGSALSRMSTGDTSENEQRIHTPASVLRPVYELWPEGIACEPYSSPDSLVVADEKHAPEFEIKNSLLVPWPPRSYVNPEYANLKEAFGHGMQFDEQVWLIPVRPHRVWWRAARRACDLVVWMNPLKFVGFEQAFPAALAIFYRGRRRFDAHDLFAPLGDPEFEDRIELVDQASEGPQEDLFQ